MIVFALVIHCTFASTIFVFVLLLTVCYFLYFRYAVHTLLRIMQALIWHFFIILLSLILKYITHDHVNNENETINRVWTLHYIFWIMWIVNVSCLVYIQTLDQMNQAMTNCQSWIEKLKHVRLPIQGEFARWWSEVQSWYQGCRTRCTFCNCQ